MSESLKQLIIYHFENFAKLTNELSGGAVKVVYDVVVVPRTLRRISPIYEGYWVSPEDVKEDLKLYVPPGVYDAVFVVWYSDAIDVKYFGLGGVFIDGEVIYSSIASLEEWAWRLGPKPGELFLHEWLHGVTFFFSSLGYDMPEGGPDGAEKHGYRWSPAEGWTPYYRDLMQGRVWEPKLNRYTGITREMWLKHCSPRFERIKGESQRLISLVTWLTIELNKTKAELREAKSRATYLETQLQNAQNEAYRWREEAFRVRREAEAYRAWAENKISELETQLKRTKGELSTCREDVDAWTRRAVELGRRLNELSTEFEKLKATYAEEKKKLTEELKAVREEANTVKIALVATATVAVAGIILLYRKAKYVP